MTMYKCPECGEILTDDSECQQHVLECDVFKEVEDQCVMCGEKNCKGEEFTDGDSIYCCYCDNAGGPNEKVPEEAHEFLCPVCLAKAKKMT